MTKRNSSDKMKLGKPLVIRLYQNQREVFEEFVRNENKILVNSGGIPKTSSDYARMIFQKGLDAFDLKND